MVSGLVEGRVLQGVTSGRSDGCCHGLEAACIAAVAGSIRRGAPGRRAATRDLPGGRLCDLGLRVSRVPAVNPAAEFMALQGRVPAEAVAETRLSSASDHSGKTSAVKPADEVSSASDQSATKGASKTESKTAPVTRPM